MAKHNFEGGKTSLTYSDLIKVKSLIKYFPVYSRGVLLKKQVGLVHAVDNVSFDIKRRETFGLVGESGCGKTTVARLILNLIRPTSGEVLFEGENTFEKFQSANKEQDAKHLGRSRLLSKRYRTL